MACAIPRPTSYREPVRTQSSVAELRNLYCRYYSGCVDTAVRKGWDSFSCTACPYFRVRDTTPDATAWAFDQPGEGGPGRG